MLRWGVVGKGTKSEQSVLVIPWFCRIDRADAEVLPHLNWIGVYVEAKRPQDVSWNRTDLEAPRSSG